MGLIMKNGVAYGAGITPITIEGTLVANATSIAFTNDAILEGERYNVYAWDKPTVKPTNMVVSGHTLTLTYPAQSTDTRIKVVINENVNTLMFDDTNKADKSHLTSIFATGSTNTTGSAISAGTYFYLDNVLVRALLDIATNATFTENTNYEVITIGGLNSSSLKWTTLISKTRINYDTQYTITLPSNWNDLHIVAYPYADSNQKVVCTLTPYSISSAIDNWINFGGATSTGNSGCKTRLGYNASTRVLSYYIETITWDGVKSNTPYIAMYVR